MATTKSSAFHPALAISNIKNFIPITLDLENVEYSSWAELFKITARAYQVLDHIIPSKDSADATASTSTSADSTPEGILAQAAAKAEAAALWTRLDTVVLQWIYGTISHDLLHTIIEPDAMAQEAWDRLTDIFLDNKHSRAVHLENLFSNIWKIFQMSSRIVELSKFWQINCKMSVPRSPPAGLFFAWSTALPLSTTQWHHSSSRPHRFPPSKPRAP
ncbi:unnamed protein product [Cuscuta epithymum]|uniref:Uncharacterized protein n=1 Tax=Cuscuta epithymum TaxID=186058 RepID=A0AAV0C943_9ASTE|nr:unnamed protein product [Cuscuta epithymum]